MEASRDQNHVTSALGVSSSDSTLTLPFKIDPLTGRLLVDSASGGSGTVTSVSVVTANGFAGTVATPTTTPAITLTTTVTGLLKGDGTTISAATAGTDYVTASSTNTFTNKTYDTAGTGNAFAINGNSITAVSGTGNAVALTAAPTFTGVTNVTSLTASSTLSAGTLSAPLLRGGTGASSTLTLESTSAAGTTDSIIFKTGSQVTALTISTAQLATFAGHLVVEGVTSTGATGTGAFVFGTSPTLTTPTITVTESSLTLQDSGDATKQAQFNINTSQSTATTTIFTLPVTNQNLVGDSQTITLTNKRITRRLVTNNAPGATPTTTTDSVDVANFTGLATAITSMTTNLTGTPVDGQLLEYRFTDNGTARAITWGASFGSTTVTLPPTTVISTMLRVLVEWNAAASLWQCIATA